MRTYVVTGSASGIGQATTSLLEDQGHRVIGADLRGAQIECDLTTIQGREHLAERAGELSDGRLDGVIAVAGLSAPIPATAAVNFFGMVATLEGLRPWLIRSGTPRAVGVASAASLHPVDDVLVDLMLVGDEPAALARAQELTGSPMTAYLIYSSSKQAFARWVRLNAATEAWAGAGIPLNAIAPGVIRTTMTKDLLADEAGRKAAFESTPMPLNGPAAPASAPAKLLTWLASVDNTHLCGQVVFIDGGTDVLIRRDSTW
jgi:NAD(P)-dependent dehydrogenase (short-subunit alcohol dehydrogenase family)